MGPNHKGTMLYQTISYLLRVIGVSKLANGSIHYLALFSTSAIGIIMTPFILL